MPRVTMASMIKSLERAGHENAKLRAERDEWKALAGALRNHEKRIQGVLMDADNSVGSAESALDAIDSIINGDRPTSASTVEPGKVEP